MQSPTSSDNESTTTLTTITENHAIATGNNAEESLLSHLSADVVIEILSYLEMKLDTAQGFDALFCLYGRRRRRFQEVTPCIFFRTARVNGIHLFSYPIPDQPGCLYMIEHITAGAFIPGLHVNPDMYRRHHEYANRYCRYMASWKHCRYILTCESTVIVESVNDHLPIFDRCIGVIMDRDIDTIDLYVTDEIDNINTDSIPQCLNHVTHARIFNRTGRNPFYDLNQSLPALRKLEIRWDIKSNGPTIDDIDLQPWIEYSARLWKQCPSLRSINLLFTGLGSAQKMIKLLVDREWHLPDHIQLYIGTIDLLTFYFLHWAYIMPSKSIAFYHSAESHDARHMDNLIPFQGTCFRMSHTHLARCVVYSGIGYRVHMEPVIMHDRPYSSEYISGHELQGVRFRVQRSSWLQHLDARIDIRLCVIISAGDGWEQVQILTPNKQQLSSTNHSSVSHDDSSSCNNTGVVPLFGDPHLSVVNKARYSTVRYNKRYIREFNMPLIVDCSLQLPLTIAGPWHACSFKLQLIVNDRYPITNEIILSFCNRDLFCIPYA